MTRADAWIRFAAANLSCGVNFDVDLDFAASKADKMLLEFDKRFERAESYDRPYTEYEQRTQSVQTIGRGRVRK